MVVCGPVQLAFAHGSGGDAPPGYERLRNASKAATSDTFVNIETPHVHPLDLNAAGTKLAVVNTADGHVEIYDVDGGGSLTHVNSIPVGVDPVTARWRTNTELWVVNQVSDSISIIDIGLGIVTDTLSTYELADGDSDGDLEGIPNGDEPADVVFGDRAGTPVAIVSCSRTDTLLVYELAGLSVTDEIYLAGEDPRSLAINTTGTDRVYAAIFESGNSSTLIAAATGGSTFPPATAGRNKNNHSDHPYYESGFAGGTHAVMPPPNDGSVGANAINGAYEADGESILVSDILASGLIDPPKASIIVKKDFADGDKWKDDNGQDWTRYVTGDRAGESGRFSGWDLLDNDIAIQPLDAGLTSPTYATRQMNICMALNVNPAGANAGRVYMVGTEATNEIRFEPNINGTFVRVMLSITEADGTPVALVDLNEEHLDAAQSGIGTAYEDHTVLQSERNKSIGDPRGVAFNISGGTAYISGMGSNNVIAVNSTTGARVSTGHSIEVGEGPTGLAHHPTLNRLYVVSKFDASVSVINTASVGFETVVATHDFFDPTPDYIKTGRVHLYGTHENSGLGQVACGSCHIDGRMDRLAWDLGNPAALLTGGVLPTPADANLVDVKGFGDGLILAPGGPNPPGRHNTHVGGDGIGGSESNFEKFHPMKGPMTTQTLQDIIGKEPHHWRGDRDGIEEFAGAFHELQGRDDPLDAGEMVEFKDFLSSIAFGPNPMRLPDNTLPGGPNRTNTATNKNLDMKGFFSAPTPWSPKSFSASGTPMEVAVVGGGNAWDGFFDFVTNQTDDNFRCVDCHVVPVGIGSKDFMNGMSLPFDSDFIEIPLSTLGNAHHTLTSNDGTGSPQIKNPQLRNMLDKEGYFLNQGEFFPVPSRAGFGFEHDGVIDGLARFLSTTAFSLNTDQRLADMMAFTLAIPGGDFDLLLSLPGAPTAVIPPATEDLAAHAGVGKQLTLDTDTPSAGDLAYINELIAMADAGAIDLIVKLGCSGEIRSWYRVDDSDAKTPNTFQSDENGTSNTLSEILAMVGAGCTVTFTVVPEGSGIRTGIDRDEDDWFDYTEVQNGTDPADPGSFGPPPPPPPPMPMQPGSNYILMIVLMLAAFIAFGTFVGIGIRRRA
jgi:DNA-binding beta-propeller fold protein YncE